MKKIINVIFALIALAAVVSACSGDSYQKRLDKEKKAIKNFLSDNEIEVIKTYPEDHIFDDNQYYLESGTGVYFRVIYPGKLTDTLKSDLKTKVSLRFDSVYLMVSNSYEQGNDNNNHYELTFTYGDSQTYSGGTSYGINWTFMSPSLVLPLQKGLGAGAEVSIIVPFVNGSSYQQSAYEPYHFSKVKYRFNVPVEPDDDTNGNDIE